MPDLEEEGVGLIYCFNPTCGPCKRMAPTIDLIAQHATNVHKLDISQHTEIAKIIGIRGTPTTLLIKDGIICQVLLGVKKPDALNKLLEEIR